MAARSARTSSSEEGIRIERRRRALADEAVHGKHFTGEKHLFGSGKAEKKNKIFMIQTVNLSLTFQGDFCVTMLGRGALRCKNAESRDVLHEQLRRSEAPRSDTRNGPQEKEHTSTANTSGEGAHFNSEYGTDKSGMRLSRAPHNDLQRGRVRSAAAQRSGPAQQPGARPGTLTENREE